MTRKLAGLTAFLAVVIAITATSPTRARQEIKPKLDITKTLQFIYMEPAAINVEGWYPGSGHTGGGMMACMARFQCSDGTGQTWIEIVNVSADACWSIDNTNVYWIEEDVTLYDDGLWVNPYFIDVVAGFTNVRAYYMDMTAIGEIYVEDYRDP